MISIKAGASIRGLRPEMNVALTVADQVYDSEDLPCRVTEGTGGKHNQASLHYVGLAVDLGVKDYQGNIISMEHIAVIINKLRERLAGEFDVVGETDHVHVEFQPK